MGCDNRGTPPGESHLCPFSCSRCDVTCPCTCAPVLVQEFDESGRLVYRDQVCAYDLAARVIPPPETNEADA